MDKNPLTIPIKASTFSATQIYPIIFILFILLREMLMRRIFLPVFTGAESSVFLKNRRKIGRIIVTNLICNFICEHIGVF